MRSTTDQESAAGDYAAFIRRQSRGAAGGEEPPATREGWERRLAEVRDRLRQSLGRMPATPAPLAPEVLGTLQREGYAIERLTFQSRPGVRVTANLYRPDPVRGRYPGVVSVHGHWAWARIDPHVQPRCIGLAKLGYVVLCLDAFGAGERAIEPGPGTYHGGLVGASLWPVGTPLIGLQVYDNHRAVDYLISRPEVDPAKLAITGASGGGNQSFYAGAVDERLSAVIPVCGIGTYDAYLTTACCVCEVNGGGAAYARTGDLLAVVAPRALMVISATRDALQFSVGEAAKSIAYARERFRLMGHEDRIRHVAIDSGHDYNQAMREAMYGWVEKWLAGRGDGSPIPEPSLTVEDVETLRCYPRGTARPKTIVTIPEFATREGQARRAALPGLPDHRERWNADAERMRIQLRDRVLGGFPPRAPLEAQSRHQPRGRAITITTERGIRSRGVFSAPLQDAGTAFVLAPGPKAGSEPTAPEPELDTIRREWGRAGFAALELTRPRGTGRWLANTAPVAGVPDHDVAEWGLWVVRWLDAADELRWKRPYVLIGLRTMSVPAILAAALDPRVGAVACSDGLISFVGRRAKPWSGVPMGLLAPNLLDVGDLGHLAALVAPRPLAIASGLEPEGDAATPERLAEAFAFTRGVYRLLGASGSLTLGQAAPIRSLVPRP
jgi:dienelactone hydrolase